MALEARWVRYGRDAAQELRDAIRRAKGSEPLAPVTVVVPSNQVGVSLRRLLASGRLDEPGSPTTGLIAVTFLTPYRLAELLGAASLAAGGRRPISTPVLTAAVRATLADDAGLFGPVAQHPATETALVAGYRELRDLSPAALDALHRLGGRAAEVVRIHRATRARLESSWYDEEDLMRVAATAVREHGVPVDVGSVVVFLPQATSRHAAELLSAVAEATRVEVLAGATGDERADEEVRASLSRFGAHPADAPPAADLGALVAPARTLIVTASDAEDEVREAVREVVAAAAAGIRLDRVAILHATADPYGRLCREQLAAADIPTNGPSEISLAERVAGRVLLELLDIPGGGYRRQDVFAWLASAPILHRGRLAPTTAWERLSREAGVVGGRHEWDRRLTRLTEQHRGRAALLAEEEEPREARIAFLRREADRAEDLRVFVLGLIDHLDRARGQRLSWSAWSDWGRSLLHRVLGDATRRSRWHQPVEEKAADRVELALDRLKALDPVEGAVGLDVFVRTLQIELEADTGRIGRFGDGVLVGSVALGIGLDLDLLIVVGMAEGSFPPPVRDDSLLPDSERAVAAGDLPLRSAGTARAHRHLLAALAGAQRQVLSIPRGDLRRSSERVPSRWVLDVATVLDGGAHRWWADDLAAARTPWVRHVASFTDGLRRTDHLANEQEHRLRTLLAAPPTRPDLVEVTAALDPALGRGAELLLARTSDEFTRFDGNLAGLTVPTPIERGASATTLESWARCPFAYFGRQLLGVEAVEHPEENLEITPMDRGSLVHQVLEDFIQEVLERPAEDHPAPDEAWTDDDVERLLEIGARVCDEYEALGITGQPIFWRRERRRIEAELRRFLEEDSDRRRATGTELEAAELPFGLEGRDPVPFPVAGGRTILMRGKADRVDVSVDGTIHVVDYKTGGMSQYKGLRAGDPHQGGRHLQLAVYAEAARAHLDLAEAPVYASYWFVSSKGEFKRAGYDVTPEVVESVGEAMGAIVDGIEAGVFVPHPDEPNASPWVSCHYCDPDGLGTGELFRHFGRKITAPELEGYATLAGLVEIDQGADQADSEVGFDPEAPA